MEYLCCTWALQAEKKWILPGVLNKIIEIPPPKHLEWRVKRTQTREQEPPSVCQWAILSILVQCFMMFEPELLKDNYCLGSQFGLKMSRIQYHTITLKSILTYISGCFNDGREHQNILFHLRVCLERILFNSCFNAVPA